MNRIALVSGANRGIGREICRQLAQLGLSVILTSRDADKGQQSAQSLAGEGLQVETLALDVSRPEQISAAYQWVQDRFGRLDVLVNNAGVYLDRGQSALTLPVDTIRATLETNLIGAWELCQAFIPQMRANGYGRVVNVSSGMGSLAEMSGYSPAYRISKTALNALTRILADEERHPNVKINCVDPGWVQTQMGGKGATRSVERGVETIAWLATLPDNGPTGGFFRDRRPTPW